MHLLRCPSIVTCFTPVWLCYRLWETGWKQRYYKNKFDVDASDEKFRRKVVQSYVEGLCWVLRYYYQVPQSFLSEFVSVCCSFWKSCGVLLKVQSKRAHSVWHWGFESSCIIPGAAEGITGHDTQCCDLVDKVVIGHRLDSQLRGLFHPQWFGDSASHIQ